MKQSLKKGIQQYLSAKSLSSQQLKQLQQIQHKQANKALFAWHKMVVAASVMIVSVVLSVYISSTRYASLSSIEQRIAEEVAANHLKLKPLEITTNTMQGITTYFQQLDFLPISPRLVNLSEQNLLGGRYCSLQGVTALQLRVRNSDSDKVQSLYQTEFDKQVFKDFPELGQGNNPITLYVKGMKVDMWVEKGILFALIE